MIKNFKEDLKILSRFLLANINNIFNKMKFKFMKRRNKRQIKSKSLIEIILEYEGAKKLGAEFLGEKIISKTPVLFYRLRRRSTDGTGAYFYVGYINRAKKENPTSLYQVVLEEDWDAFIPSIKRAIETNQKTVIGIRMREGGTPNGSFKSRTGRKVL